MDFLYGLSDETLDRLLPNLRKISEADYINEISNKKLKMAATKHSRELNRTSEALDDLNRCKCQVLSNEIARFVDSFGKIKNIDFKETEGLSEKRFEKFELSDYESMCTQVVDMRSMVETSIKVQVLGGILLGGLIMHKKAKTIMNNALTHKYEIDAECERIETNIMEMQAIRKLAKQENKVIRRLSKLIRQPLQEFCNLSEKKENWVEFTIEEKKLTASLMSLMKLLKDIIDQPVINEEGDISSEANTLIEKNNFEE